MKKTLYVTDLDGTLLNSKKAVSKETEDILNRCIEKGMLFAVATARMPYGCDYRLEKIKMNVPGILTNGVFLYDFLNEKVIAAEEIPGEAAKEIWKEICAAGFSCFVYGYDDAGISLYYDNKEMESQEQYYSSRALEKCAEVRMTENMQEIFENKKIVYMTYTGEKEMLEPVCKKLDEIKAVSYSFYLNIYNGLYCLEIFSEKASKKNALKKLKEMTGCEEVVVFGDNLNDISMIEIADRSYAPANALQEIKERVNKVLEDCDHDGVARFLAEEWSLGEL